MIFLIPFLIFIAFISLISALACALQGQFFGTVMGIAFAVACIYGTVKVWPKPTPPRLIPQVGAAPCPLCHGTGRWFDPTKRLEVRCTHCGGLRQ